VVLLRHIAVYRVNIPATFQSRCQGSEMTHKILLVALEEQGIPPR